jgi:WD40 repeat protein
MTLHVDHAVRAASLSLDGTRLLTNLSDSTALLWAVKGEKALFLAALQGADWLNAVFSPDGRRIAAGTLNGTTYIWQARTGRRLATLRNQGSDPEAEVDSVTFSADSKLILTTSYDDVVRVWDATSRRLLVTLNGHSSTVGTVNDAQFSPDGAAVLTASDDHTVRLWDAHTGREEMVLRGHTGPVYRAVFSPDGGYVASASDDGTVRIWQVQAAPLDLTLPEQGLLPSDWDIYVANGTAIASVEADESGNDICAALTVRIWSTSGRQQASGRLPRVHRCVLDMSPNGATVAMATNSALYIWGVNVGRLIAAHPVPGNMNLQNINADREGDVLATCAADGTVRVWAMPSGKLLLTLPHASRNQFSMNISRDGRVLMTIANARAVTTSPSTWSTGMGTVDLWDVPSGRHLRRLSSQRVAYYDGSLSPDGMLAAAIDFPGFVKLWQVRTGRLVAQLGGAADEAVFSPDSAFIVTYGFYNIAQMQARVWDAHTGRLVSTLRGGPLGVNSVAFSPDNSLVVTAGSDATARVWEVRTGRLLLTLPKQSKPVTYAAFSPDQTHIVLTTMVYSTLQTRGAITRVYACDICAPRATLLRLAARTGRQLTALERTQYMYPLQGQ